MRNSCLFYFSTYQVILGDRGLKPKTILCVGNQERAMIGTNIDEGGMLIREGGSFYLRCDRGGRYLLELHHMPVNLVGKRVKLTGRLIGPNLVNVDDVAAI